MMNADDETRMRMMLTVAQERAADTFTVEATILVVVRIARVGLVG